MVVENSRSLKHTLREREISEQKGPREHAHTELFMKSYWKTDPEQRHRQVSSTHLPSLWFGFELHQQLKRLHNRALVADRATTAAGGQGEGRREGWVVGGWGATVGPAADGGPACQHL